MRLLLAEEPLGLLLCSWKMLCTAEKPLQSPMSCPLPFHSPLLKIQTNEPELDAHAWVRVRVKPVVELTSCSMLFHNLSSSTSMFMVMDRCMSTVLVRTQASLISPTRDSEN